MDRATKAELRQEIAELRHMGRQMANVLFNLHQRTSCVVDPDERQLFDELRRGYDAIQRRERRKEDRP